MSGTFHIPKEILQNFVKSSFKIGSIVFASHKGELRHQQRKPDDNLPYTSKNITKKRMKTAHASGSMRMNK